MKRNASLLILLLSCLSAEAQVLDKTSLLDGQEEKTYRKGRVTDSHSSITNSKGQVRNYWHIDDYRGGQDYRQGRNPLPPPNPPNPSIPIDGGVSLLLLAGAGYGMRELRAKGKNRQ